MKTVTDAVRELGGYPDNAENIHEESNAVLWYAYNKKYCWASPDSIAIKRGDGICTRAEFEAEAGRLGYPRCTVCGHLSGGKCNGHCINANPPNFLMDNDNWHERGELPPIGVRATVDTGAPGEIYEATVVGHDGDLAVCRMEFDYPNGAYDGFPADAFRPLRTDRERWIEETEQLIEDTTGEPAQSTQIEIIHDAILDGTLPTPGDNQ